MRQSRPFARVHCASGGGWFRRDCVPENATRVNCLGLTLHQSPLCWCAYLCPLVCRPTSTGGCSAAANTAGAVRGARAEPLTHGLARRCRAHQRAAAFQFRRGCCRFAAGARAALLSWLGALVGAPLSRPTYCEHSIKHTFLTPSTISHTHTSGRSRLVRDPTPSTAILLLVPTSRPT